MITRLPGSGQLTLAGIAVTAGQFVTLAEIKAGKLVWSPGTTCHGTNYASFTFQVQDDGGTANGGVDLDPTPNTITRQRDRGQRRSGGHDKTVTTLEDTAYTFTAADFGFSDPERHRRPTRCSAVKITTLPGAGSLTLNGVAVTAGQFVSAWPTSRPASSRSRRRPTPTATGYASFTFQVQDDGGTANGGVDLDPTPNTMTVNVTAVNDAPAGTTRRSRRWRTRPTRSRRPTSASAIPNDTPANSLLAVKITTLPAPGS